MYLEGAGRNSWRYRRLVSAVRKCRVSLLLLQCLPPQVSL